MSKSNEASQDYLTFGLSLAPHDQSGYQTCSSASPGCSASCLYFQGRARVHTNILAARVAKTIAFFEHRRWFARALRRDLAAAQRKAARESKLAAVRLNVLSDVPWEKVFPWVFSDFEGVTYYDYGKNANRMLRWCAGKLPPNYHLTFSRSEVNERDCLRVLDAGGNVAVVFRRELPDSWHGFEVVNGDETDLRFLDPHGVVVGLKAKGSAKNDNSGFVVDRRIPLEVAR